MRMYSNPFEAFREVERDLGEMGIEVQPQTMQDKDISKDANYLTKEIRAYGFHITGWKYHHELARYAVMYVVTPPNASGPHTQAADEIMAYIEAEFSDRMRGIPMNPGTSYKCRQSLWQEFLHDGKFHYTYSERIAPQLRTILQELKDKPGTRQAIINIHSNIQPTTGGEVANIVYQSADLHNMGGKGRIPCSMYYQLMIREGKLDLIYTMRSCDFLTHFPVDVMIALKVQNAIAETLQLGIGKFTYFTGSLHAYHKDISTRGIF